MEGLLKCLLHLIHYRIISGFPDSASHRTEELLHFCIILKTVPVFCPNRGGDRS